MAKKITFYLYDNEWNLAKKDKKIFSPFNVAKMWWPPKFEMEFDDPKYVLFVNWVYETEDTEEWKEEQSWLPLYNNIWWTITVNWKNKYFKWDWNHYVKMEAPVEVRKTVTKEVEVEVAKIPRQFAETLTVEQLKSLCEDWNVPTDENTIKKEDYIKKLDESWKIA